MRGLYIMGLSNNVIPDAGAEGVDVSPLTYVTLSAICKVHQLMCPLSSHGLPRILAQINIHSSS